MKIALVFPGYGSQFVGMGKELYDESRVMQEYFEEASNCLNVNFVKLCFASSDAEISKLENALVANFLVSVSLYGILKERGVVPHAVVGHDAGAYAAVHAAGGISLPDMLYLIQKYVSFYQDLLSRSSFKAIRVQGLDEKIVREFMKSFVNAQEPAFVSVYESPTEHIIAGHESSIALIRERAKELGSKKVIDLAVVDGLHSALMVPVEEGVRLYSEKVDFKELQFPLMVCNDASLVTSKEDVKAAVLKNIIAPLHWYDCVKKLVDYDVIIQIGPGKELATKIRKTYPDKKVVSVNEEADIKVVQSLVASTEPKVAAIEDGK